MTLYAHNDYPFWFKGFLRFKALLRNPFVLDRINLFGILGSIAINIGIWLYLKTNLVFDPFNIILHYRVHEGATVINTPENALYIPLVGILVILMNVILAVYFYKKDRYIAHVGIIVACLAQVILLASSISIVLANK